MRKNILKYNKKEEILNSISHTIGILLSLISLIYLLYKAVAYRSSLRFIAFFIYGICLSLMFLASTIYHASKDNKVKRYLRLLDHCAIFTCIAGTYTPVGLLGLNSKLGVMMVLLIWILAFIGIFIKVYAFMNKKFDKIELFSLLMYILMGWLSIFFIKEIINKIGLNFFYYILLGGIFYSIGVFFYKNKNIRYNHFVWHIFILLGSMTMNLGIIKFL